MAGDKMPGWAIELLKGGSTGGVMVVLIMLFAAPPSKSDIDTMVTRLEKRMDEKVNTIEKSVGEVKAEMLLQRQTIQTIMTDTVDRLRERITHLEAIAETSQKEIDKLRGELVGKKKD